MRHRSKSIADARRDPSLRTGCRLRAARLAWPSPPWPRILAMVFLCLGGLRSTGSAADGEPILPLGRAGARPAAMAGAAVALPGGAESMFTNPAGLSQTLWYEGTAGAAIQDIGAAPLGYLAASAPLVGKLVAGAGWVRQAAIGNVPLATEMWLLSMGFPLSINGRLQAGVTAKFLQQAMPGLNEAGRGAGVDLGLLYQAFTSADGDILQFGLGYADARTVLKHAGEEAVLPAVLRFGSTYRLAGDWLAAVEFDNQHAQAEGEDSFQVVRLGVERTLPIEEGWTLQARLGLFHVSDRGSVITLGLGAEHADWRLAYVLQLPAGLQNGSHQISLSWGWQRASRAAAAETESPAEVPEKKSQPVHDTRLFSALESAALLEDTLKAAPPREIREVSLDRRMGEARPARTEPEPAETETYRPVVPQSPADEDRTDSAPELELPGLFASYVSGIKSGSETIRIVNQDIRLHVVNNPFSPNKDGRMDRTIFVGRLENDKLRMARWMLYVLNSAGQVVRSFKGGSRLPHNLEWDGTDARGKTLADGTYNALLRVFDENGMELAGTSQSVKIQTKTEAVTLTGPGTLTLTGEDDKPLAFTVPKISHSSDWKFVVTNSAGRRLYERSAGGEVPEKLAWAPKVNGRTAPAGRYLAQLSYRNEAGLPASAKTEFRIRYASFDVNLSANPERFVPQNSGGAGVRFSTTLEGETKISEWNLKVLENEGERVVRSFAGRGQPPAEIPWDGADENGKPVEGGLVLRAVFTAVSSLGTEASAEARPLQADLSAYSGKQALSINLVRVAFSPGSAELTSEAKRSLLDAAGTVAQYKTNFQIRVFGHADAAEAGGKGGELSRNRAKAAAAYLCAEGKIASDKVETMGYGADKPLAAGSTEEDLAKNRRVEVVLLAQ